MGAERGAGSTAEGEGRGWQGQMSPDEGQRWATSQGFLGIHLTIIHLAAVPGTVLGCAGRIRTVALRPRSGEEVLKSVSSGVGHH